MIKNKLKELRLREKLTQREVAEIIGVTQRAYQNYEKERRMPSLEIAVRLSELFSCSVESIFFTSAHCKTQCNKEAKINNAF